MLTATALRIPDDLFMRQLCGPPTTATRAAGGLVARTGENEVGDDANADFVELTRLVVELSDFLSRGP